MQSMLSRNIKYLREKQNMSREKLAESIYETNTMIQIWELDKCSPSLESLTRLSILFDVSLDSMVFHDLECPMPEECPSKNPDTSNQENLRLRNALKLISENITSTDRSDFVEHLENYIIEFSSKYKK